MLVTGASAGIGQAAAVRFAAQGARVLVHGRDPDRTAAVASSVSGRALLADLAFPEERRRLAAEVEALYVQFVGKVAAGRKLDVEEAERHARGRVWMGSDAHARRLVDVLGGLEDAVRLAEELAGAPLEVLDAAVLPRHRTLLSRLVAAEPVLDELLELAAMARERALFYAPRITFD